MMIDLISVEAIGERSLVSVDTPHGQFAIARVDDSYYLFSNSCSHASCPLSDGMLSGTVLMCDCHFSEFDIPTGRVLTEPAEIDLVVREVFPNGSMLSVEDEILISMGGA